MAICARLVGGAGTGKTTAMIQIMEKALERPEVAGNPLALGFSSFTRAARTEAANRAGAAWNVRPDDLTGRGWFRTAHSVAYRQLQVSKGVVIGDSKKDAQWVSEAVGSDVAFAADDEAEGGYTVYTGDRVASDALNYWSLARNLLMPLRTIVEADWRPDAPSVSEVVQRVKLYETAKRLDGRCDFTDLLCRFAGVWFDPEGGPEEVAPEGKVPETVVGWIFDEAQDSSRLLDRCCRRLLTGDAVKWGWIVGDPWQVLYSWAGASSEHFMRWDVGENQKIMPKSYRCAAPILALGERCLRDLPDYWDRKIAPADHDGEVIESENYEDDLADLDPTEETLVVTRTNRHARACQLILDEIGVPYRRIKGKAGAHNSDLGMGGLWKLQHGKSVVRDEWSQIMEMLPSKTMDGRTWLVRGSKARWERELAGRFDRIWPEDIEKLGATPELREAIFSGKWASLPNGGTRWVSAAKKWGVDVVSNPRIRIGTIHSAKGMEASKVILLTSVGKKVRESEEMDEARAHEERRIEYVAVTRAKHKLIVAHDPREKNRMDIPV